MSPWWAVLFWLTFGALVGTALRRPSRAFLPGRRQAHPLIAAATLASVTACLFGLLAWGVGVRPELLAYSALAAVGVPLAAIDVLEQRLRAYPVVAALLALARSQNTTARRYSFPHRHDLSAHLLLDHRNCDPRRTGRGRYPTRWTTGIGPRLAGLDHGHRWRPAWPALRQPHGRDHDRSTAHHPSQPHFLRPSLITGAFTALLACSITSQPERRSTPMSSCVTPATLPFGRWSL